MASSEEYNLSGTDGSVVFRTLAEGLKVALADGAVGEIIGNPGDGAYLILRIVESEAFPARVGGVEYVFFGDVKAVV